jgi:S1-C subfamily serine protease
VVGMNTSGPRYAALTLPANLIDRTVTQVLSGTRLQQGYLGLGLQPLRLPESMQTRLPRPQASAVIVISLEAGGPTEQAGILLGDILLQLGEAGIQDLSDLYPLLEAEQVGQTFTAQILRGGSLLALPLTIGARPEQED